jgi:hypothetical protein
MMRFAMIFAALLIAGPAMGLEGAECAGGVLAPNRAIAAGVTKIFPVRVGYKGCQTGYMRVTAGTIDRNPPWKCTCVATPSAKR